MGYILLVVVFRLSGSYFPTLCEVCVFGTTLRCSELRCWWWWHTQASMCCIPSIANVPENWICDHDHQHQFMAFVFHKHEANVYTYVCILFSVGHMLMIIISVNMFQVDVHDFDFNGFHFAASKVFCVLTLWVSGMGYT